MYGCLNEKVRIHQDRRKARQVKGKVKSVPPFSQTSRGLFAKNLSSQAKQSISLTTVTFYSNCMKMCEDFAPNFGDKGTVSFITTTHPFTLHFYQKQRDWRLPTLLATLGPLPFFCFPD
jgi:hypothetical protein